MWHKFPLLSWIHQHTHKEEIIVGGFFLPNNSRHSVGLNLSLQLLSSDLLTLCFHEFWNNGPAPVSSKHWLHLPSVDHSWYHRQQKQWVPTPNLCPSVELLLGFLCVLYTPSTCQPFCRSCTFTSMRLLYCQTWLKLFKKWSRWIKTVWPVDGQIILLWSDCIRCQRCIRHKAKIEISDIKFIFVVI